MKTISHKKQQEIWEKEHSFPLALLQMDSSKASFGVVKFWEWLKEKDKYNNKLKGIEMGCGKGRNVIWLAKQGVQMMGFDFSPRAIIVAKERAKKEGVVTKTTFLIKDSTKSWDLPSNTFDFGLDCFATTDIESKQKRQFAVLELIRVIKSNGYILSYVMSTDEEFHKEMIKKSPAREKNAFFHPVTGKFEKVFEREELIKLYSGLKLVIEERVPKTSIFFGKKYKSSHHWMVFKK